MNVPLPVRVIPSYSERAWFTPPPLSGRVRASWEADMDGFERLSIDVDGETHTGFRVGEGPLVLLVHGWGGRASQMAYLGRAIASAGFTVIAFDSPGHGEEKLASTNVYEMAAAIESVVSEYGKPTAVVAHSLGAMALAHAMRGRVPERVVLVAPVLDIEEVLDTFAERARLLPWSAASLRRRIRSFVGDDWDEFAAGRNADLGDGEVLIVHDPDDDDTSFSTSAEIAVTRPNTYLIPADSFGHVRVLRDPGVATAVSTFVSDGVSPRTETKDPSVRV